MRELDPRTKRPAGEERGVFASTKSRLAMDYPKGNTAIGVAVERIVFEASSMIGNIYLAKPRKR